MKSEFFLNFGEKKSRISVKITEPKKKKGMGLCRLVVQRRELAREGEEERGERRERLSAAPQHDTYLDFFKGK